MLESCILLHWKGPKSVSWGLARIVLCTCLSAAVNSASRMVLVVLLSSAQHSSSMIPAQKVHEAS